MKKFVKFVLALAAAALLVKGLLSLIDYLYETYAVRYVESDLPLED